MATPKQAESRMLKVPFQIGPDGGVAYVNSPQQMAAQEVRTIVQTYVGERLMKPRYGSGADIRLFAGITTVDQDVIVSEILDALGRQEVLSRAIGASINLNPSTPGMLEIQISYMARALPNPETVTIPVTL